MTVSSTVRLGVLSDLHLAPPGTCDSYFRNRIPLGASHDLLTDALRLLAQEVDTLLLLGDLADQAQGMEYAFLLDALEEAGLTVQLVHGNHDLPLHIGSEVQSELTAAVQRRARGAITIVGQPKPSPSGAGPGAASSSGPGLPLLTYPLAVSSGGYRLELPARSPTAIAGTLLVFVSHFPPLSLAGKCADLNWPYPGDLTNHRDVLALLRNHPGPVLSLSGHLHLRAHAIADNVLQLHMAALAEPPHDAAVLTVTTHTDGSIDVTRRTTAVHRAVEGLNPVLDSGTAHFVWSDDSWHSRR